MCRNKGVKMSKQPSQLLVHVSALTHRAEWVTCTSMFFFYKWYFLTCANNSRISGWHALILVLINTRNCINILPTKGGNNLNFTVKTLVCYRSIAHIPADPQLLRGARQPQRRVLTYYSAKFPQNCMKTKLVGQRRRCSSM